MSLSSALPTSEKISGSEWKYLLAILIPILPAIGLYLKGNAVFLTPVVLFGFLPILEFVLPPQRENMSQDAESLQKNRFIFDLLLYLNVPFLYGLLGYFFYTLAFVLILAIGTALAVKPQSSQQS